MIFITSTCVMNNQRKVFPYTCLLCNLNTDVYLYDITKEEEERRIGSGRVRESSVTTLRALKRRFPSDT